MKGQQAKMSVEEILHVHILFTETVLALHVPEWKIEV